MGSTYANITLVGAERSAVIDAVERLGADAFISPIQDRHILVCPQSNIPWLAGRLSRELACVAWAVQVFDSDVLVYDLFVAGLPVDSYNSLPGYGTERELPPSGGDAAQLAAAFGLPPDAVADIEPILRSTPFAVEGQIIDFEELADYPYLFAEDRHQDLADLLLLPTDLPIRSGFDALNQGVASSGVLSIADFHLNRPFRPVQTHEYLLLDTEADAAAVGAWYRSDDYAEEVALVPLGARAEVAAKIGEALPEADTSVAGWIIDSSNSFTIDFDLGPRDTVNTATLYVRGQRPGHEEAARVRLRQLAEATGWRIFSLWDWEFV